MTEAEYLVSKPVKAGAKKETQKVVCVDDVGDCGLTSGREYEVEWQKGGMVTVTNDRGEVQEYFLERFRFV